MAKHGTTTRTLRFLPYRYEPFGLEVTPLRSVLDKTREVKALSAERCLVDLVEERFETATIDLGVKLAPNLIASVFPPEEHSKPPGRLILALRCAPVRLRQVQIVAEAPLREQGFATKLTLRRSDLRGSLEIIPFLVRAAPAAREAPGLASVGGARLASGRPWEVRIDLLREIAGQYLEVAYVSFREQGRERFPWPENLYKLDCDTPSPILLLNSDHERIAEVLNSKGTVGARARIREVLFDAISHAVWTRLFLKAAHDVRDGDEPRYEWENAVLSRLLPAAYPEHADRESRIAALRADLEDGEPDRVLERLEGVLQKDFAKHVERLVEDGTRFVEGGR